VPVERGLTCKAKENKTKKEVHETKLNTKRANGLTKHGKRIYTMGRFISFLSESSTLYFPTPFGWYTLSIDRHLLRVLIHVKSSLFEEY
jgi:hypothetical protein